MITPLEARIMRFLRQYLAENETSPSLRDIGEAVGVSSRGTVNRYIHRLIDKGYLVAGDDSRRSLHLTDPADGELTLPLLGRVAAGKPIEAIEDRQQLNLSQLLGGADRFVLEVKGESMINAGILPNDLVILQRSQHAQNGDIVLALIDNNEATLKRIKFHRSNKIELIPENDDMTSMHYKAEQVQIQGVLAGVVRSYK
ncbi:MAG: repressor LexA [Proteobacteria bacterium]|nr:repressor LexA [Pseudomonadota bacterium]